VQCLNEWILQGLFIEYVYTVYNLSLLITHPKCVRITRALLKKTIH
jgi:hypothetical protein